MKHLPLFTALGLIALMAFWNLNAYDLGSSAPAAHAGARNDPSTPAHHAPLVDDDALGRAARAAGTRRSADEPEGRERDDSPPEPGLRASDAGSAAGRPDAERDAEGRILAIGPRVDGLRAGRWQLRWPSGTPQGEGEYRGGVRVGSWTFWHETGAPRACGDYVEGCRDGEWREWHDDGGVAVRAAYEEGELHGAFVRLYTNGQVRESGRYVRGLREGPWEFFDFAGRVDVRTGTYVHGRRED